MRPTLPVDEPALPEPATLAPSVAASPSWRTRLGHPPRRPLLQGFAGSLLLLIGAFGAGGILVRDPILSNSALGFWRYGHGRDIAILMIYSGLALMVWAWVRLGRDVLARRVGGRGVLTTAAVWLIPMLFCPPLFTRDIFSYLAQGGLPLAGFDPYAVGPDAMSGIFTDNVHYFWQDTPAPYGPLFILIAKSVAWLVGDNIILGVVLMRLALVPGLLLLVWALPELTRRLGGRVSVALWIVIANPMMVIHMVGGGHNDLLVIGLLALGALYALRGRNIVGIALVTAAMAVKASAVVALPFLVLVWAAQMSGSQRARIAKAIVAGLMVFVGTFAALTVAAGVSLGWLPALSAPSMIVNWMSLPTAIGQIVHGLVRIAIDVPQQPFVIVFRVIGGIVLGVIAVKQWWAARDNPPDAIRRAGIVLLAVAALSPAMLPWYPSWGMVLLAAAAWTTHRLQYVVFGSIMLVIVYNPNGEDALYNWPYLFFWGLIALLAAVSLTHRDPLRLAAGARTPSTVPAVVAPAEQPATAGAEQRAG